MTTRKPCIECGGMGVKTYDIIVGGTEHDTEDVPCERCKDTEGFEPEPSTALRACPEAPPPTDTPDDCTPREEALSELIWWMLGDRDRMPPMPEHAPYWWRRELRARFEAIYAKYPSTGKVRAEALAPSTEKVKR